MKIAIYPGSFDPITNGHLDIIERVSKIFDKVIVTIAHNSEKSNALFTEVDRKKLILDSVANLTNVEVDSFEGLLMNYAVENNAIAVIRGLRALSDFEFEFKMALMNRSLNNDVSTLFMMPHAKYTHISSSLIREVASLKGDVSQYVPKLVVEALSKKFNE
jgi:pantetheine-phosphate adenylyltransferase